MHDGSSLAIIVAIATPVIYAMYITIEEVE